MMRGLFVNGQAVSDGEPEEELNELAAKCFDSDPDMNVPLKKLRGVRKEKIHCCFGAAYSFQKIYLIYDAHTYVEY